MALENMGLGGILTFDERAGVASMGRADTAFKQLNATSDQTTSRMGSLSSTFARTQAQASALGSSVRKIGGGLSQMAGALRAASLTAGIMSVAVGGGVAQAAKFEQQMSAVRAITGASGKDFNRLTDYAEKMGIESVFSATQSAQAMEYLGRAGFSTTEILGALQGTMAAAAADGIDLATAADIVASQVRAFGLKASDAGMVADVLALASAKANTNITGLAEGLKYVAPITRQLGVDIQDTTATLALLADSGLKGSLAGTALKNALLRLASPTGTARKRLEQLGLQVADNSGNFVGMGSILNQLSKGVNTLGGNVDVAAATSELFGIRGVGLTNILSRLQKGVGDQSLTWGEMSDMLHNASGAAKEMADIRLKNLLGRLTLLGSSLEALSIQLFGPLLTPLRVVVENLTTGLNSVLFAMKELKAGTEGVGTETELLARLTSEYGQTAVSIAQGVLDGIKYVQDGFSGLVAWVQRAGSYLEDTLGPDRLRQIAKLAVVGATVAAGLAPVLLAVGGIAFLFTSVVIPAVSGAWTVIAGLGSAISALASGPLVPFLAAVGVAFLLIKREGETTGEALVRIWGMVKGAVSTLYTGVLQPLWTGIKEAAIPIVEELGRVWTEILGTMRGAVSQLAAEVSASTGGIEVNWRGVGQVVIQVLGTMLVTASEVLSFFLKLAVVVGPVLWQIGSWLSDMIVKPLGYVWDALWNVGKAWSYIFGGKVFEGFARLSSALLDMVLTPIRLILSAAIRLADALDLDLPAGIKTFAEKGITGLVFPEKPQAAAQVATQQVNVMERAAAARAASITGATARMRGEEARPPEVKALVDLQDKRTLQINNRLTIDGREVAIAAAVHKQEIQERAGFKATPWQRRMLLEQGAAPVGTQGG